MTLAPEFRANLVAMHLWAEGHGDPNVKPNDNYFLAGGVITGRVILGADGWRMTEIANQVIWRQGTGFQELLQTEFNRKSRGGGSSGSD